MATTLSFGTNGRQAGDAKEGVVTPLVRLAIDLREYARHCRGSPVAATECEGHVAAAAPLGENGLDSNLTVMVSGLLSVARTCAGQCVGGGSATAMKYFGSLAIATSLLLATACRSDDLTREKAAAAITTLVFEPEWTRLDLSPRHFGPYSVERNQVIQSIKTLVFGSKDEFTQNIHKIGDSEERATLTELRGRAEKGMIKDFVWRFHQSGRQTSYYCTPVLADEFSRFCVPPYSPGNESCGVKIADKRFERVTGITSDADSKLVYYELKVVPTEFGKRLGGQLKIETRYATFQRYDDGWRMVRSY